MPGGPPWNFSKEWNIRKELVDQGLHILAALAIFAAISLVPWPWNGAIISLGIMVERERIQHENFPFVGAGSLLDMIVWGSATILIAVLWR